MRIVRQNQETLYSTTGRILVREITKVLLIMWDVLETIGSPCVIGEVSLLCEGMSKGEEEGDEDDENESDDEGLSRG